MMEDCSGGDHDGWRNPRNAPYEHAFASYGAAAAWAAKYPPIHANPFDHAGFYAGHSRWAFDYIANESRQEEVLCSVYRDPEEEASVPWDEVIVDAGGEIATSLALDWLRNFIGVTPPSLETSSRRDTWLTWWKNGAGGTSDDQKRDIWRFFAPRHYLIIRVELAV